MDFLKRSLYRGLAGLAFAIAGASHACDFAEVRFVTDFDTARLDGCEQVAADKYRLHLRPENLPINPSPWYAFRMEAGEGLMADTTIEIVLVSHNGPARYTPKVSLDKKRWAPLPYSTNDNRMRFNVQLQPERAVYVAGQEIIDGTVYADWLASLPATGRVFELGASTEQRALLAYEHRVDQNAPWLVLIGRQHPPEVTGALAMLSFTNTLMFADTPEFVKFRDRFNILVVPNMNPDGVARGNWRHTSNGVDLNRDWRARKEPESKLLHDYLTALEKAGSEVVFALDFHSTHNNIYYTMPPEYEPENGEALQNPMLVRNWLNDLAAAVPWEVREKPGHNPSSGVFKQYVADNFAVHAVTYEVGDTTDRREIVQTADAAALSLVTRLLAL
ncbi:M14 family metallopeptidase [Pseudidiomarina salilacus]|uniref:M14 family metallopeptidase n=1 Tax=Pseudidiomarina salilacus TaxID=3384452 RepID=UPI003984CE98